MTATGWISETWDRVVGSDPGLQRLRNALSAAVAMSTALGLEYAYGQVADRGPQGTLIAMLLGTIIAMMGSTALGDGSGAWRKARTAAFFPVAIGGGMAIGVLVASHTTTMLVVFVAVMSVAVYIRRFGLPYFFYGFLIWIGYFFASFLHASMGQLPAMLFAIVLATVWVLLLMTTVLRTHHQRTLARVRRAFAARARAVARVCADLLEANPRDARRQARLRRKLHSRHLRLAETALVIEGWSGHPGALPPGRSAASIRRHALDAHLAIDALATAAEGMSHTHTHGRLAAARIAGLLAQSDYATAEHEARELVAAEPARPAQGDGDCLAHRLATATWEFAALTRHAGMPDADEEVAGVEGEEAFEPTVALAMGALPGSIAVAAAGGVTARSRWNSAGKLSLLTRQSIQVAVAGTLAILAGRELSQARYYWAVLAAFVAFAGTATRSETFIKATNRVVGTLLGLGAGIGLAHLTAGHTYWIIFVIILSMSCGFYLVSISYAAMIFFVTIMVSQLYSELHEFSASLLALRLEETAIGAAIGIAVALVVLPTSTRDTVISARSRYYTALGELLHASAARLEAGSANTVTVPTAGAGGADLDALIRVVDHRLQQLALVARPLTRPLLWGNDSRLVRHRLTLYSAVTRQLHALALGPRRAPGAAPSPHLAAAARALADATTALALAPVPKSRPAPEVDRALRDADAALLNGPPAPGTVLPPVTRSLLRLQQLLRELTVQAPADPSSDRGATGSSRVVASGCSAPSVPEQQTDPPEHQEHTADEDRKAPQTDHY
jgi:fusaric acid resistance family protein